MEGIPARLSGTVALVTGAARLRGIGRATALRLAREGAAVVVAGRPGSGPTEHERRSGWEGLPSLVAEIEGEGGSALAATCDVGDAEDVAAVVAAAVERFGRLDTVVSNAATGRFGPRLVDLDDDEWQRVLHTNLTGTHFVCRAAARVMIGQGGGGAIVTVSSVAGRAGVARMGAYSPAKFGVIGLTQVLAAELAEHGIRVNCVVPGGIETDMEDATLEQVAHELGTTEERARTARVRRIPLGRLGSPDEIAAAVAFLASSDAGYVTGQTLNVSGGPPFS